MNLVMTSTPLAIVGCGFTTANAADVVSWHVLAMFAPSFFTGNLIARFGAERVIAAGLVDPRRRRRRRRSPASRLGHFSVALILLGLGWNFGFIGATAMLTAAHTARGARPRAGHERLRGLRPRLRRLAGLGRADELHRRRPGRRLDRGQPGDGAVPRRRRRRAGLARADRGRPCWRPAPADRRPPERPRASAARATSEPPGAAAAGRPPAAAPARPASRRAAPAPPPRGTRPRCARARAIAASPSRASAATSVPARQRIAPARPSSGSAASSAAVPAPRAKSRTTGSAAPSAPRCRAASSIRCPAVWST